jgi:aminopeptidase N
LVTDKFRKSIAKQSTFFCIYIFLFLTLQKIFPMKKLSFLSIILSLLCLNNLNAQVANIDVLHYDINLNVNNLQSSRHIGFTEITFLLLEGNPAFIEFDLKNQTVDSVFLNNNAIDFNYQNNKIRIALNNTDLSLDTLVAKIYYQGGNNVEPYNWGGIHYSNNIIYTLGVAFSDYPHSYGRSWFVCNESFTDKAKFDFHITTNKDVIAVCSGNLINESEGENSKTFHWKLEQNSPIYSVGMTIANFSKLNREITSNNRQIPLNVYYFANDSLAIEENFRHIDSAFICLEKCFGDFKFNRVGYCTTPKGSMEHIDNISLAHSLAAAYSLQSQSVIVHEMGHSWFGNLITCATSGDMWINEGWTTFTERLSLEAIYGENVAKEHFREKIEKVINNLPYEEGRFPLSGVSSENTYSSTVYDKGALITMSLRAYMGDSLFYNSVQRLLQDFAFSNIDSYTLRDSLSSYSGIDLTDFFSYYVFDTITHHFAIESLTFSENSAKVKIFSTTENNYNQPCSNTRIPITFMDSAFNRYKTMIIDNGTREEHNFSLPFTPIAAFLDFDEDFFDLTTDSYKFISEPGNYEFKNSYFKANITSCQDTILIRPTLHWIGADNTQSIEGINRFSQKHYWTIEGINLENADIEAKFYFKVSPYENNFDNSLLAEYSAKDSIILLYREDATKPWYRIEANHPSSSSGYVTTKLRKGDFIMAIGDKNLVGLNNDLENNEKIKIYPNPSSGAINISHPEFKKDAILNIFNENGSLIFSKKVKKKTKKSLFFLEIPKGFYLLEIQSENTSLKQKFIVE